MNETKWLTGTDGDAMLEFVSDRLSPAAVAAGVGRVRPAGSGTSSPRACCSRPSTSSSAPTEPLTAAQRAEWQKKIDAAVPETVGAAELAQREIVKSADPDAAGQDAPVLARPTRSRRRSRCSRPPAGTPANAIEWIGEAVGEAAAGGSRAVRRAGRGDARTRSARWWNRRSAAARGPTAPRTTRCG